VIITTSFLLKPVITYTLFLRLFYYSIHKKTRNGFPSIKRKSYVRLLTLGNTHSRGMILYKY